MSKAAAAVSDNAANSPYSNGWQTGDNGGSGFGAWTISGSGSAGVFVGGSDIGASSWGLYANSGGLSQAVRSLSSSLAVGQTFSLQMDNGFVNTGGTVGFSLQSSGANRFEFLFIGGQSNYLINDSTTGDNTGVGFTSSGLTLAFQLTGADAYSFTINGGSAITGNLGNSGGIDGIRFYNANAGPGSDHDLFFNNLSVVPEPSHIALAIFGGLFLVGCGVRRLGRKAQA